MVPVAQVPLRFGRGGGKVTLLELMNTLMPIAAVFYGGYVLGKTRGWGDGYKSGHEHGETIGRMKEFNRALEEKLQARSAQGKEGE